MGSGATLSLTPPVRTLFLHRDSHTIPGHTKLVLPPPWDLNYAQLSLIMFIPLLLLWLIITMIMIIMCLYWFLLTMFTLLANTILRFLKEMLLLSLRLPKLRLQPNRLVGI